MTNAQTGPNAQQVEYWNSPVAQTWVRLQTRLDQLFHPLTQVALEPPHPNLESARSMSAAAAAPPCWNWPVASDRAVMYSALISPNRCWTSPAGAPP